MKTWMPGILLPLAALFCAAPLFPQKEEDVKNPLEKDRAAMAAGKKLFAEACGTCHGTTGHGGRGPNLADGKIVQPAKNKQLFDSIRKGVAGTEMPPCSLEDEKIWQLVAFLRDMTANAFETEVPGDAAAGKALFFGKARCAECHMIRGQGGLMGPDLANIGLTRSVEKLREAILQPDAEVDPSFRGVTVVTVDGRKIEGVARNYSNYSIQVVDREGRLHLLERREWRELDWHKKSLMPDNYAQTLSSTEVQDLLAFLSRQSTGSVRRKEEQ
ncbi:MAG: c-type cytochrome [Acidobacteria bacterium]|nr:c-type cytochrome [Acidobacteriota bacterium]